MKNRVLSSLVSVLFFGFASAAWADITFENGVLTVNGVTDLNGKSLTIEGIKSIKGDAKFTNTAEGDPVALTLGVEKESSVLLSELSGKLKIVKTGEGTLTLPKTSSYSGGTEVRGGVLNANSGNTRKLQSTFRPYGMGKALDVYGGTLEGKAYTDWSSYHVLNLRGGTFKNTAVNNTNFSAFNVPINLFADSTYSLSANYSLAGKVDLGGRTLTMSIAGNSFYFNPASVQNGTLHFKGTTGTCTLEKSLSLDTVDVVIASKFDLNGKTFDMRDLTVESTGVVSGSGALRVLGVLHTTGATSSSCTMMNDSTIDLSKVTEDPWSDSTVSFDSEAQTVKIALGDRVLEANQKIVSWDAKPEGVTFTFTGTGIGERTFSVSETGIVFDAADDVIVSATWTGNGEAGNWQDPANWQCYNASDEQVENVAPEEDVMVRFTGNVSGLAFNADFPFHEVRLDAAVLEKDANWTGFDFGRVTDDSSIDLKGHALTVTGGQDWLATKPVTFTDTVGNGVLELTVAEGLVVTNAAPVLTGALKLVKKGLGAYVAKKNQAYTGVTEIAAGSVVCETTDYTSKTSFGAAKTIKVDAGAVLDPAGSWNWTGYTIELNGGSISNTVGEATHRNFNPALVLNAESTFYVGGNQNYNFLGTLTANGHGNVLKVEIDNGKYFTWEPTETDKVTVRVNRGGWFRTLTNVRELPNMTLEMKGAALKVVKDLTVKDYIAAYDWNENDGTAELKVCETFKPACDYFYGCTLQDGATIDLSEKTAAWSVRSQSNGNNTVKFAEGAIVTMALGERTEGVAIGDTLVSWPEGTPYEGRVFLLTGTAAEGKALSASATGLTIIEADDSVHTAVWTGAAGDGDLSNAANWSCQTIAGVTVEGVPDEGSIVQIPASALATLDCPAEMDFAYAVLQIVAEPDADPVVLTGDRDWRGLGGIDITFPIDLNGHDLKVALGGDSSVATLVTNKSETVVSTLAVTVGEGKTYNNTQVAIGGNLTLIKEGPGTFVAAKTPQTYSGETVVREGVLACASGANVNESDKKSPFGSALTINLEAAGVLDPRGSSSWGHHTINARGGSICNTVEKDGLTSGNVNATLSDTEQFNPTLNLYDDLTFETTKKYNFRGKVVANGHTLKLEIASGMSLVWYPEKAENALVQVTGGGTFKTNQKQEVGLSRAPGMTLEVIDGSLNLGVYDKNKGHLNVSNYVARGENKKNDGGAELKVWGAFKPVTDYFYGCTMQNGSTIDLSERELVWNRESSATGGKTAVSFAEGARVTIDVGTREFRNREKVIGWTEKPSTLSTLTFDLNAAAKAKGYRLTSDENGLYVERKGLVLIFQ